MDIIDALRIFLRVTETGSFSAVARESNLSQSSITRRFAQLEEHFGVRLLRRTTRSLSLTEEGKNLQAKAREIILSIDQLESDGITSTDLKRPIPNQGPGPYISINFKGQMAQRETPHRDQSRNDIVRLRHLLPLVRQAADDLMARLPEGENALPELTRDLRQYSRVLSQADSQIEWGLLWGLGVRLENAAAAAERKIANQLAPVLDDSMLSALQSLRSLHAPLILATSEGRLLQEQADMLGMTREEQSALRSDAIAVTDTLMQNPSVIEETRLIWPPTRRILSACYLTRNGERLMVSPRSKTSRLLQSVQRL